MLRYSALRLGQAVLTVLLLLVLVFGAVRLTDDPAARLLPETATDQDRADLRAALHLDQPLAAQFVSYLRDLVSGDLGRSYKWNMRVSDLLLDRLPVTLNLAFYAGVLTLGLGLPLGIVAARRRGTVVEQAVLGIALIGQSVPIFVTALLGILLFSVKLGWLPVAGVDRQSGYVLPAVTLGWFGVAAMIRITRVSMLNALQSEYILTARASGLRRTAIVYRHALRNALIPIVTIFGLLLATLLTGAVVTETMFGMPGLGRLAVDAIVSGDFPVLQGVIIFTTIVYIFVNFLVDLLYGIIDPRIRAAR
jgi:peptide/nickel transport system permease protein